MRCAHTSHLHLRLNLHLRGSLLHWSILLGHQGGLLARGPRTHEANGALVEQTTEDAQQPKDLELGDHVAVLGVRDQDRHHLPQVHRGREDESAELLYLRVDEPLASHGSGTETHGVHRKSWMHSSEPDGWHQAPSAQERAERYTAGAQVDVEHLVVSISIVSWFVINSHRPSVAMTRN